jgi:hypothetical protein
MRRASCLWLCLLIVALTAGNAPAAAGEFDQRQVRWTALELTATKLLMSARARVETSSITTASVAARLVTTPTGRAVVPGPEMIEVVYRASGLGRESVTMLWAEPSSGATVQQFQEDIEGRRRQRTYRYTDVGAWHYTRRPATPQEESLAPSQWTDLSQGLRPFPASTHGRPVGSPPVLLWMASAADLSRRGDRLEVLTFSRRHLHQVVMEVTGTRAVKVDYVEKSAASGTRRRQERIEAIAIRLRGVPMDAPGDDDEPFELLGLRGDLELLLDPQTRVPLQLKGRVKIAGPLTVRLREAMLR